MLTDVKCPICGKTKRTTGNLTFRCCNREFLIEKCRTEWNDVLAHKKDDVILVENNDKIEVV